jgi:hypothetical protein
MDQFDNTLVNQSEEGVQRPTFLKVLCILSFVLCGLWIVLFLFAAIVCFGLNEDTIAQVWDRVTASQPMLTDSDPILFFREVAKLCLYNLVANLVSLVGVIMMWRLNRNGFFIYVMAELGANFLALLVDIPGNDSFSGSFFFNLIFDLVFIVLYAVNLKHMKKTANGSI